MSAEWKRVPSDTLCGLCYHRLIPKGEPALYRTIRGVKRERVRCQDCSGQCPTELPPLKDFSKSSKEGEKPSADFTKRLKRLATGFRDISTERNWYETERDE